jgi:hypothetical protein
MLSVRKTAIAAGCLIMFASAAVYAAPPDWLKDKGTVEQKLKALADIQEAAGSVMIEYAMRYTNLYYAAKGGNWGLAGYQLKEQREIQEVAETTRPQFAPGLKAFESTYLEPLAKAIEAKDYKAFKVAFDRGVEGCNSCHASHGFPYIKFVLPKAPYAPLSMKP